MILTLEGDDDDLKYEKYMVWFGAIECYIKETPMPIYSCPSLVVPFFEELISRPFLDENRFRLVSQDHISAQNAICYLVFVSRSLFV